MKIKKVEAKQILSELHGNKNKKTIYSYTDSEGYCDYRLFFMDDTRVLFFSAWENGDGSLRYTEEARDSKIQYIIVPLAQVSTKSVEGLHDYIMGQYELMMRVSMPDSKDFIIIDSLYDPEKMITSCLFENKEESL